MEMIIFFMNLVFDIGMYGKYVSGSTYYTGLVRDASAGGWHLFTSASAPGSTSVSNLSYSPLRTAALTCTTLNASGNITGNLVGNASTATTAGTVTTAAQTAITSVGTLTGLNCTGNVGIGTNSPLTRLHSYKAVTGDFEALKIQNSLGGSNGNSVSIGFNNFGSELNTGFIQNYRDASADYSLRFSTWTSAGLTEHLVLRGGNVGIGTNDPSYKLDVSGTGRFTDTLHMSGTTYIYFNDSNERIRSDGTNLELWAGGAERMTIGPGNVGIGTNNPQELLHIQGSSNPTIRIQNTISVAQPPGHTAGTEYGSIDFWTSDGNFATSRVVCYQSGGGTGPDCGFKFYVNENSTQLEAMNIKHNGNVGIGTTNPLQKLHVFGNATTCEVLANASGTNNWCSYRLQNDVSTVDFGLAGAAANFSSDAAAGDFILRTGNSKSLMLQSGSGGSAIFINSSNNVGIGDSSPSYKLDVSGDINLTGSLRINGTVQTFGGGVWTESNSEAYYLGNVGIGTNNPAGHLTINGGSDSLIQCANSKSSITISTLN
jgi:hypothetical protein